MRLKILLRRVRGW